MSEYKIEIMRGNMLVANITPHSSSSLKRGVMQDYEFSIEFSTDEFILLQRGDNITYCKDVYILVDIPNIKKKAEHEYIYTCHFYSRSVLLNNVIYMFLDLDSNGDVIANNYDNFSITSRISNMLDMLVANINRIMSVKWNYVIHSDVDITNEKNLNFAGNTCKEALELICDNWECEWFIDNGTIHLSKRYKNKTNYTLSYPYNLLSPIDVKIASSDYFSRLYVNGSERNLPKNYGHKYLKMSNNVDYIEIYDNRFMKEKRIQFDDIYPRMNSCVKQVLKSEKGYYFIQDNNIDFDLYDYYIDGVLPKIHFNSGKLMGMEFEVASFNKTNKTIEIKQQVIDNTIIPSDNQYPMIGDEYVLLDIYMPESYVIRAENELYEKALKYFEENASDKKTINIKVSDIYLQSRSLRLNPYDEVRIIDKSLSIDCTIRVVETIEKPFNGVNRDVECTLSDIVEKTKLSRIKSAIDINTSKVDNNYTTIKNVANTANFNNNNNVLFWNYD